ncbi:MAG: DUF2878 domain-containing protein [Acidobacteria bacterium]|nr:DUF2878 domain-containing protein [Acidobacteriota bacterium]
MKLLINVAGFQLAWFACVIGAGSGQPWVGPVVTLVVLAIHVILHLARRWMEIALIMAGSLIGYAADSTLVLTGLLVFPEHARLGSPSTLWMVALWASFAGTLNVALRWLDGRYLIAALLGVVGGPVAYYAGLAFDALALGKSAALSLGAVAFVWGLAAPVLVWFAKQLRAQPGGMCCFREARP